MIDDMLFLSPKDVELRLQDDLFVLLEREPKKFIKECMKRHKQKQSQLELTQKLQKNERNSRLSLDNRDRAEDPMALIYNARDRRRGFEGRSLLHACVSNIGYDCINDKVSMVKCLKCLIHIHFPINVVDSCVSLRTALMTLLSTVRTAQTLPMIELLLRHGADPFHQDSHGDCALHYAARYGDVQVILCILRDVTSRSQECGNDAVFHTTLGSTSSQTLKRIASIRNYKGKYPEHVTTNDLCCDVLRQCRLSGGASTTSSRRASAVALLSSVNITDIVAEDLSRKPIQTSVKFERRIGGSSIHKIGSARVSTRSEGMSRRTTIDRNIRWVDRLRSTVSSASSIDYVEFTDF